MVRAAVRRLLDSGNILVSGSAGLTRKARLARFPGSPNGLGALNRQERREGFVQGFSRVGQGRVPLVKSSAATIAVMALTRPTVTDSADGNESTLSCGDPNLGGRCILCVDGRAALYPEYRRLVETSGGNLLIYRSNSQGKMRLPPLPALLAEADMVICPVDCVNHHAFFTVQRYCQRSGKPCVLLDRSGLPTFRKGVAILAALTAVSAQA